MPRFLQHLTVIKPLSRFLYYQLVVRIDFPQFGRSFEIWENQASIRCMKEIAAHELEGSNINEHPFFYLMYRWQYNRHKRVYWRCSFSTNHQIAVVGSQYVVSVLRINILKIFLKVTQGVDRKYSFNEIFLCRYVNITKIKINIVYPAQRFK